MSFRLLLVEDDRELRTTLREALDVEGYEVITAASLNEALAIYNHSIENASKSLAVILLDLGLPDGDGHELLIKIRRKQATPIIVISARENDQEIINLLDKGADDYLVKPFSIGELLARIRVALRHRGKNTSAATTRYANAGITIDLSSHKVLRDDVSVHLTPTEFKLLARLVRNAGQIVTHRQLLQDVWGQDYLEHTHYLRLYMAQLRAKLEINPAQPQLLLTEPGIGYRLQDSDM